MKSISKRIALSTLVVGLSGCSTFSTFSTESLAPPQPIQIDGRTNDWRGNLFVEGEGLELGFLNDREYLYLCLLTQDRFRRAEILTQGLTVWFDPQGGTHEVFGIKFPLGLPPSEQKLPLEETKEGPELKKLPDKVPMTELEILRAKQPPQRLPVAEAKGIEVKVATTSEELVYELKIPLVSNGQHPFAVGTEPGKKIGVGFESSPLETSEAHGKHAKQGRPPRGEGEGEGGGAVEPGEEGLGQQGRRGYGRESPMQEPMKIWAFVNLVPD